VCSCARAASGHAAAAPMSVMNSRRFTRSLVGGYKQLVEHGQLDRLAPIKSDRVGKIEKLAWNKNRPSTH
jgi:hypothetical protein